MGCTPGGDVGSQKGPEASHILPMSDVCKKRPQAGQQGSASGSRLLDLDGLEVVSAKLVGGEWQLAVQTTTAMVGCASCGVRATPHGRHVVRVRDLPATNSSRDRPWNCRRKVKSNPCWQHGTRAGVDNPLYLVEQKGLGPLIPTRPPLGSAPHRTSSESGGMWRRGAGPGHVWDPADNLLPGSARAGGRSLSHCIRSVAR